MLTERLRHLHLDRGYEPAGVLAVAYNKQAQLEMEARTTDFRPRVRTLNSLGLWVLAEHRGGSPPVVDEPEVRRLVDSLIPGKRQRRSNTDPIGPYVEGLTSIRLGLTDPELVEASRDDVPGLAELFPGFRQQLARRGAVDFDEQIYGAVEVLLADGPFRRSMQRSCRHLLVDEFQDLTPAHVLLVRLLSLPALDVFGVGDDDQCIYGHAGADPAFLIDYERLFPGAVPHPLTVNYRCPVEVVDGARTLLGYNHRRVAEADRPRSDQRLDRRRRCASSSTVATTAPPRWSRWSTAGWANRASRRRRSPCWPASTRCCWRPTSPSTWPASRCRRCCGPTSSSAPASAPPSPTCASPPLAMRWTPATSSRSSAARPAACRSGSPTACTAGPGGRCPSSPGSPTRCRTRTPRRCCGWSTTCRS